jgi:hypothetical protein
VSLRYQRDPCEWNPLVGRPAEMGDIPHGVATVSLGDGAWHLCHLCAALPAFERFKVRKLLASAEVGR